MPSITQVMLVTRALSYVLDKHFDAKGKGIREKATSAQGELGPDLTRDLTQIANTADVVKRSGRLGKTKEFNATVDRVFRGLRQKKPQVAEDVELELTPATPAAAAAVATTAAPEPAAGPEVVLQKKSSSNWGVIAIVVLLVVVFMSVMGE